MATLEEFAGEHPTSGFRGEVFRAFVCVKRWRDRRRTLARLSRLSERQLRDVGFDSADTCDSLNGQQPRC